MTEKRCNSCGIDYEDSIGDSDNTCRRCQNANRSGDFKRWDSFMGFPHKCQKCGATAYADVELTRCSCGYEYRSAEQIAEDEAEELAEENERLRERVAELEAKSE